MNKSDIAALTILTFFLLATALPVVMVAVAKLLGPRNPSVLKNAAYECGEVPVGRPWIRFRAGYYVLALIFVIFDIEAVFIYPWVVEFRSLGVAGLIEMAIFVAVLMLGWVYAWRKGLLEWV